MKRIYISATLSLLGVLLIMCGNAVYDADSSCKAYTVATESSLMGSSVLDYSTICTEPTEMASNKETSSSETVCSEVRETIKEVEETTKLVVKESTKELTSQDVAETAYETKPKKKEKQVDVINACDVPNFNDKDKIGYMTYTNVGISNVPFVLNASQYNIDNYDIGMMVHYSVAHSIGAGHPFFLFAHSNRCFKNLQNAQIGDIVNIDTVYQGHFKYKVTNMGVGKVSDDEKDLYDITTGKKMFIRYENADVLYLITCADRLGYAYNYRICVKCELVSGTKIVG